jgi:hypothetical protein
MKRGSASYEVLVMAKVSEKKALILFHILHMYNVTKLAVLMSLLTTMMFFFQAIIILLWLHCAYD